ncbi:WecB/TagA/CpsF family glycosyltransferase [Enterococcus faecalis]|uniref:WecB/TagA/CpsF family glycosyltransferase n=1 Tax=Enterococcus faecalis TaxID=1351 RepID=UPI001E48F535|nr:WecB/TagA/CpsF family glycosyltransferase [Enterococcus faecalis]MCD5032922.1 WecB/TagA/CpsF family glycosyltransferase [Enterococcus faecalis]
MKDFVQLIEQKINNQEPTHVLGVNADKIVAMRNDAKLRNIMAYADIIHPDGISMILASRILKKRIRERVAGIDLMEELLRLANDKEYTIYFLGSKDYILNKMIENLVEKYPDLKILGFKNGYFSREKWSNVADDLKSLKPHLVFIGITSPKKEYLIDYLISQRVNTVFMGVGGSFDVLSGEIKRAPLWVQNYHLEWCFRLLQEPKRLFKRYFFGNLKFFKLIVQEKIKSTNNK